MIFFSTLSLVSNSVEVLFAFLFRLAIGLSAILLRTLSFKDSAFVFFEFEFHHELLFDFFVDRITAFSHTFSYSIGG